MNDFKNYLDERNVNKTWLAREIGISRQAINQKLRGAHKFSEAQALKIKTALRMSDDEFELYFGS